MQSYALDTHYLVAIQWVLNSEGAYSNDPNDSGGPTSRGIALNYNAGILKEFGIFTAEDMRTKMTSQIAKEIYYRKYWLPAMCHVIPDPKLQYIHFDTAVNHGVGAAARCLLLIRLDGKYFNPKDFLGPPANTALWYRLCFAYIARRQQMYTHDRNRQYYLEGWVNRLSYVIGNALKLG